LNKEIRHHKPLNMPTGSSSFDTSIDPLTAAIAPPPNESTEEKRLRLQKEEQARLVSEAIDADISRERNRLKKEKPPVRVLLLGQSESGAASS
jgi:guanine nucleotide-binding protein alpha-1 subunit